ncbi:hypothetical protein FRB96_004768 [Tulasnella sp. 330]|nr:hypothetical protein FRB96_004768 [Tulasnella sp. 330]
MWTLIWDTSEPLVADRPNFGDIHKVTERHADDRYHDLQQGVVLDEGEDSDDTLDLLEATGQAPTGTIMPQHSPPEVHQTLIPNRAKPSRHAAPQPVSTLIEMAKKSALDLEGMASSMTTFHDTIVVGPPTPMQSTPIITATTMPQDSGVKEVNFGVDDDHYVQLLLASSKERSFEGGTGSKTAASTNKLAGPRDVVAPIPSTIPHPPRLQDAQPTDPHEQEKISPRKYNAGIRFTPADDVV